MTPCTSERIRWLVVVAFAAAMAWVEAASVFYIRTLVDRVEPYQPDPLPIRGALGNVELVREVATLLMIGAVGWLAAQTWPRRVGYAALAFGVWDTLYYVFLRVICGWPDTVFAWDILFLLPLPWWGPVLAPLSIAVLMILWGTLVTQAGDRPARTPAPRWPWGLASIGIALALAAFMADAVRALPGGRDAVLRALPAVFNWPVFWIALLLMSTPVAHLGSRVLSRRGSSPPIGEPTL